MLGGSQGLGGTSQRTGGLWPLASAPVSPATSFTSDGYSKYGFYSLFSGAPTFGSTLYSHNTVGRFGPALQAPGGTAFHTTHKVSDSLFSATGYTFGAPTPPPGSPHYSPVSVAQLEFLTKGYTTTTNSNIIIQQSPICPQQELSPTPITSLSPTKKNQIIITPSSHHTDTCSKDLKLNSGSSAFRTSHQSTSFKHHHHHHHQQQHHHQQYIYQPNECMLKLTTLQKEGGVGGNSAGCSRTNPLEWTTLSPIHVKKEPGTLVLSEQGEAIIKMEMNSPGQKMVGHHHHQELVTNMPSIVTANGNIPVGIAVGRQRIQQEVAPSGILTTTHFKEVARISEIADMNAAAHHAAMQQHHQHNQQNQLHSGATTAHHQTTTTAGGNCWGLMSGIAQQQHCHQAAAQQNGAGATLWTTAQYPTPLPMEPLLPMSAVGLPLQLVREPTSGGFLLFPTTGIEPVHQAAAIQLWPNAASAYPTPTPTGHVLLPPLPPPPQPPPPLQLLTSTTQAQQQHHSDISTYPHHHLSYTSAGGGTNNTGELIATLNGNGASVGGASAFSAAAQNQSCSTTRMQLLSNGSHVIGTIEQQQQGRVIAAGGAAMKGCFGKGIKVEEIGGSYISEGGAGASEMGVVMHQRHEQIEQDCTSNLQIYETSPPLLNLIYQPTPPSSNSPPNSNNQLTIAEQLLPEQTWKQTIIPPTSVATVSTSTTTCRSQATSPVASLTPPLESGNTVKSVETVNSAIFHEEIDQEVAAAEKLPVLEKQAIEEKMVQDASNQTEAISDEETATVESKLSVEDEEINVPNVGGGVVEYSEDELRSSKSVQVNYESTDKVILEEVAVVEDELEQVAIAAVEVSKPDFSGLDLLSSSILEHETNTNLVVLPEEVPEEKPDVVLQKPLPIVEENLAGLDLLCALAEQRLEEEVTSRCESQKVITTKPDLIKSRRMAIDRDDLEEQPEVKKAKIDEEQVSLPRRCNNCNCNVDDEPYKNYKTKESEQEFKKFIASKAPSITEYNYKNMAANGLMNDNERDMRQQLADLQRKYKEKQRELNKLKPHHHSGGNSKKLECTLPHQKKKHRKKSTNSNGSTDRDVSPQPIVLEPQIERKSTEKSPQENPNESDKAAGTKLPIEKRRYSSSNSIQSNGTHLKRRRKVGRPKKLEWSSDNDSSSNNLTNPSTETIVAKKPKKSHHNLVGYLLAAKEKLLVQKGYSTDSPPRFVEEVPVKINGSNKKIGPKLKAEARVSIEISSDDFLEGDAKHRVHFESEDSETEDLSERDSKECVQEADVIKEDDTIQVETTQNSSDFSSDDCQPLVSSKSVPNIEETEDEEVIVDSRCVLTQELLESDRLRVLTAMGGLFYAGNLNAVQPPDVYSITLDGERGNRPHIMSREEILRDAIVEVSPTSTDDLPPGTRLCAYWSQQYRCLYPGSVAEPASPSSSPREFDKKFVAVEFDDGDNGTIAIEDIRLLPCDYPIIEYDPNPLLSLSKRRRRLSTTEDCKFTQSAPIPATKAQNVDLPQKDKNIEKENKDINVNQTNKLTTNDNEQKIQRNKERKRLKKRKRDKLREKQRFLSNTDGETLKKKKKRKHKCLGEQCKHRRHHKKHKKHHRKRQKRDNRDKRKDKEEKQEENLAEDVEKNEEVEEVYPEYHIVPNPDDEVTMDDIIEDISQTKSKKIRDRQESCESRSKMSAFLPPRQFWNWSGKGYKRPRGKGRSKKEFFKSIQRGKENMSVGDSAVFLSTGRPDRPYIGKIEAFWETCGTMVVKVKWFYHPEETNGCPLNLKYPGALFESPHVDENDVQTISHHCRVVPLSEYTATLGTDPTRYATIYDNNDIYYRAGYYDPTTCQLSMEQGIPLEDE